MRVFRKSELKSICIPLSLMGIGSNAFRACKSLDSVPFEAGAVVWESGLKTIVIPASVEGRPLLQ
jgi:hypothetical protein